MDRGSLHPGIPSSRTARDPLHPPLLHPGGARPPPHHCTHTHPRARRTGSSSCTNSTSDHSPAASHSNTSRRSSADDRAGETGGGAVGRCRWRRILPTTEGSERKARTTIAAEHRGHCSASTCRTRLTNWAHASRRRWVGACAWPLRASGASGRPPESGTSGVTAAASRPDAGSVRVSPLSANVRGAGRSLRSRERFAKTPWYRIMCAYGAGTRAARRRRKSSGSRSRICVPPAWGQGRRSR